MWNTASPSASCISDAGDDPQCTSEQPVPVIATEVPGQPDERSQLLFAVDTDWQETPEAMLLYVDAVGGESFPEKRGKFSHQPSFLVL